MNVFSSVLLLALVSCQMASENSTQKREEQEQDYKWSKCYDDLGCINNTEKWYHPVLRPIKEQPLNREIIKTSFNIFEMKKEPKRMVVIEHLEPNYKGIKISTFHKKLKTHIFIHDFTSNGVAGWIKQAAKSLLAGNTGNVISVDWASGAEPPYQIAIQNARVVALEIAHLMNILLNEFSMKPDQFHLIGQGVGAHIAGYVGQKIGGISRITGLDPNGLFFANMPRFVHLDPEDAKFVDIIHTDIATNHGQGSGDPFGHLNFYPNGGLTQAGCNSTSLYPALNDITRDHLKQGQVAPGCSHKRAAKYFAASIDERECTLMGYLCVDYAGFERGECLECQLGYTCAPLGYPASNVVFNLTTPPGSKMFLDTNDEHPFCMFAYKVTVTLVPGESAAQEASINNDGPKGGTEGMFCATIYSDSEGIMFRTNLNLGTSQKTLNTNGDNVFLTYQKAPKLTAANRVVLSFDSEQKKTVSPLYCTPM